jgi:hypothetical protein
VPASNTAVGHIILENKSRAAGKRKGTSARKRVAAGDSKRPAARKRSRAAAFKSNLQSVRKGKR